MGGKRSKAKQAPKKGKAKRGSGNPAKRAAEEKAAKQKTAGNGAPANPFGMPGGADQDFDPSSVELPKDLSKYLK